MAVLSQWLAPVVAMAVIVAVGVGAGQPAWPLWWSAVLALAAWTVVRRYGRSSAGTPA
mgnify:CR=1 FL=1